MFGRLQLLKLDSAEYFRHLVRNLHTTEIKDLNSFFEGAVNSKFLAHDNILKKEAVRLSLGDLLTSYLSKAKKDYQYYNNYTQLIRSMSRLQLVDLNFFNDQANTLLSSLEHFNRAHGKALAVIYSSYV